jgi:hypothetical protein
MHEVTPLAMYALHSCLHCMQEVAKQPVVVTMWWPAILSVFKGIYNGPCPTEPAGAPAQQQLFESQYGPGQNDEEVVVGYDARSGIGGKGSYWKIKTSKGNGYYFFEMLPDGTGGKCGMYTYPTAPLDVA